MINECQQLIPTILGILTFRGRNDLMLSSDEREKFYNLGNRSITRFSHNI